jgi:hypothetical protein
MEHVHVTYLELTALQSAVALGIAIMLGIAAFVFAITVVLRRRRSP